MSIEEKRRKRVLEGWSKIAEQHDAGVVLAGAFYSIGNLGMRLGMSSDQLTAVLEDMLAQWPPNDRHELEEFVAAWEWFLAHMRAGALEEGN